MKLIIFKLQTILKFLICNSLETIAGAYLGKVSVFNSDHKRANKGIPRKPPNPNGVSIFYVCFPPADILFLILCSATFIRWLAS